MESPTILSRHAARAAWSTRGGSMSLAHNPGSLAEDTPRLTTTVDLREGSVEELEGEYAPDAVRTMNVNLGSDMLDAVHSGRPMSRAESICDLIIKSDRVFLYGKC